MKQSSLSLALCISLLMFAAALCQIPWVRSAHSEGHVAVAATGPVPSSTGAAPTAQATLSAAESKQLLLEFQRAQSSELKALEHRNKLEVKELKASHSARQHEWERKEKEARHKFFAEHTRGPDRRSYIRDFMDRHRVFIQVLNEERTQRIHDQEVHYNSVKEDQAARLKEFQQALSHGERPSSKLWPAAG